MNNEKSILYDVSPILGFYSPIQLIEIFELLNNKIGELNNYSSSDFLSLTTELKEYSKHAKEISSHASNLEGKIKDIISGDEGAKNQIDFIIEKSKRFFSDVTKLITDLQFHDIIRQKLENIQRINSKVIEELYFVNQIQDKTILVNRTDYVEIIPDIALLQFNQFGFTNNEFLEAINSLKKTLIELEVDTIAIVSVIEELTERFPLKSIDSDIIQIIDEINNLGIQIANKAKDSVDKLKHSDLFNGVIKELKIILTKINSKVKLDVSNKDYISRSEKLTKITKVFTVSSEHDIHKRLFVKTDTAITSEEIFGQEEEQNNEDDLELF